MAVTPIKTLAGLKGAEKRLADALGPAIPAGLEGLPSGHPQRRAAEAARKRFEAHERFERQIQERKEKRQAGSRREAADGLNRRIQKLSSDMAGLARYAQDAEAELGTNADGVMKLLRLRRLLMTAHAVLQDSRIDPEQAERGEA